jgi:hypothetical protein
MSPSRIASWRRSIACCTLGGVVYAKTPFMQQVHECAFDFTRFTEVGHRRLFRRFDDIDRGVAVDPASALLWAAGYFARSVPRRTASRTCRTTGRPDRAVLAGSVLLARGLRR